VILASVLATVQCSGESASPPAVADAGTSTSGVSSEPSPDAAATTEGSGTTTSEGEPWKVFEGETFSFEYPAAWQILDAPPQPGETPLEQALVGPGNQTDGVAMQVFEERGFETEREVRRQVAAIREQVRRESGRLVEGPEAFWDGENQAIFFTSYIGPFPLGGKLARQVAQIYVRQRVYRFACQYAPSHEAEMDEGCSHALETLTIDGLGKVRP
jgi:hypothetical protein